MAIVDELLARKTDSDFQNGADVMANLSNDEQQLRKLYRDMWRALIAKDIAKLDEMHADDFVLVHMTGMRQTKTEYLRYIRDGELNYFNERAENVYIDVEAGKMTGQSKVEAAVFGGGKHTWNLQLAFDVEKRAGKWILKFATASTY